MDPINQLNAMIRELAVALANKEVELAKVKTEAAALQQALNERGAVTQTESTEPDVFEDGE